MGVEATIHPFVDGSGYALRVVYPPLEDFGDISSSIVADGEPVLLRIGQFVFDSDIFKCDSHLTHALIWRGLLSTCDEVFEPLVIQ